MTIRILLADDQELVRTGFRMILSDEADLAVVGEAVNGLEAVSLTQHLRPDVVLMDIRMPELDGIEATRRIVAANERSSDIDRPIRVLMLTTFDLDEYVFDAIRAGASGFLLKDVPADQLCAGLRMVAAGDALLAPTITRRLIDEFAATSPVSHTPAELQVLTSREQQVLGLLAKGMSNAEIASELMIGENTVKTHVARTLMKLNLRDRVQAVVLAYELGIVTRGRGAPS